MDGISAQAAVASALRALDRLAALGEPIDQALLAEIAGVTDLPSVEAPAALNRLLEPLLMLELTIGAHGPESLTQRGETAQLVQAGWRSFLISVVNPGGHVWPIAVSGGGTIATTPAGMGGVARPKLPDVVEFAATIRDKWWYELRLDSGNLSGCALEFFVLSIYSRDAGERSMPISFWKPLELLAEGHRRGGAWERVQLRRTWISAEIDARVTAAPAYDVLLDVRDYDGRTCVASITVLDDDGRVYPSRGLRLAPDMFFQDQVYRATGESIRLPEGGYEVTGWRGPEYRPTTQRFTVAVPNLAPLVVSLDRWVDPAAHGYYSGDPHIHGGGCSHYSLPTEGVTPETMIRHVRGEGLWVSSVLTWGPCYYYQKQFFTGRSVSPPATLEHPAHQEALGVSWEPQATAHDGESTLRYDVEISGFPSSHSGHLVLLGLTDQDYPGTSVLEDWPSWNLPIHRWAREQGALTGFAHGGGGMATASRELPNFDIPPFSSVGSNEVVVDAPHDAVDFIAGAELGIAAEMNVWYHLLNVGFRTLMLGETDFPCMSDERPGIGRTYVSLPAPPVGPRALESWIEGLRTRPSYFGDGRSHAFGLAVDGETSRDQQRARPGVVRVTATIQAMLPESRPQPTVRGFDYGLVPADRGIPTAGYVESSPWPGEPGAWHLEWARIGDSREVLVEAVMNGHPVASTRIVADGSEQNVAFDIELERSSWIALRLLPSLHSQPIFVEVSDQPIRASRRSAEWLIDCVDKLWEVKHGFIRPTERDDAYAAYEHAKTVYALRRGESEVD